MEEYLNLYNNKINPFVTLKNSGTISIPDIEVRLPRPLFELHELLTRILKDNKVLANEEDFKLS